MGVVPDDRAKRGAGFRGARAAGSAPRGGGGRCHSMGRRASRDGALRGLSSRVKPGACARRRNAAGVRRSLSQASRDKTRRRMHTLAVASAPAPRTPPASAWPAWRGARRRSGPRSALVPRDSAAISPPLRRLRCLSSDRATPPRHICCVATSPQPCMPLSGRPNASGCDSLLGSRVIPRPSFTLHCLQSLRAGPRSLQGP